MNVVSGVQRSDFAQCRPVGQDSASSRSVYLVPPTSLEADPQLTEAFFVDRLVEKPKPQGPLVIPALKNKDWRELARKRKSIYVPPSAAATTGTDGSVGGLGTRDTINSGPQLSGLQVKKKAKLDTDEMEVEEEATVTTAETTETPAKEEETEDQKALRLLLSGTEEGATRRVEIIPAVTEDDAFKQDVGELPESATLDDYERVPVEDFGAALLRGMGWKEGTAASRKGKGPVEPWLPQARPALLGIGAKEKEVFDDGSKKKGGKRPERRYVPVIKKERKAGESEESGSSSRRRSPSPRSSRRSPEPDARRERDRDRRDADYGRDRDRTRDRDRDGDRDRDRNYRDRDRERDRHGEKGRDRDRERERDKDRDGERRRDDRRERDRDGERRRDRSGERSRRDRDRRDR